ncbi:MAG: heavy metal translocating P-type ATPase metal-binding domain-containing protein [Bacteroidetes bacterium]|nr:heavy metal translocating P-type ATPase metal-binding domain-containing protein [Bacteroidota bacterium]
MAGSDPVEFDGKVFCCHGCRAVYEILSRNQLCDYYQIEDTPGRVSTLRQTGRFEYLDNPAVAEGLVERYGPEMAVVRFRVPQMHCSSCIWLLENLQRLDSGVRGSRTEFLKKRVTVRFHPGQTTLRRIVELLASLGYEPELNLSALTDVPEEKVDRSLYIRVGVAAFCFGNIMLFSLPEYLSSGTAEAESRTFFYYLNLILSIPVTFYSASIYFSSAIRGLAKRIINIDVPIALGIAIVFLRSVVDVLFVYGPGYFDSLTGLVFLLLIGRVFQIKTYEQLNFDRRYEAYLPLAVTVLRNGITSQAPVTSLKPGDRVLLRNQEVLPADGVLMSERTDVDYSFVTGEQHAVAQERGALLHAGGRIAGVAAEVELVREVSQSSLAQVWDSWPRSGEGKTRLMTLGNTAGKYFTIGILLISAVTAIVWMQVDASRTLDAVTAVLIVACPCALSLAAPFAFGTAMRILGRRKLFFKNAAVVESLARVDTVIFDKTGTLTATKTKTLHFEGTPLSEEERTLVASLAANSAHPLSRSIVDALAVPRSTPVEAFEESEGKGVRGRVGGIEVRLGSASFIGASEEERFDSTRVHLAFNGKPRGSFGFETRYRERIEEVLQELGKDHELHVLSGDGPGEEQRLRTIHSKFASLMFRQSPTNKLSSVRDHQERGRAVLMLGDGLNDAAALWQADVGIAVTEDVSTFTPACDGIMEASTFPALDRLVRFARTALGVVHVCIGVSLVYNIVGLWFAVRAELSPLLAAVLMPASSITVVALAVGLTEWRARRKGVI